jgi:hypothetical protein
MRFVLGAVGFVLLLYLVGYVILRTMSVDGERIPIAQAIRLSIVRRDVERIARAEHAYMVSNDDCLSLRDLADEPDSDNILSGRFGYTYSISCDDLEFSVTATHPPAPQDSHLRFPNYVAHSDLLIHEFR